MRPNLNDEQIPTDDVNSEPLKDFSRHSGDVRVYFKDLTDRLVSHIDQADVVVGCVAWLTNWRILKALGRKHGVSIVVQKEDFLRPDTDNNHDRTRQLYAAMKSLDRCNFQLLGQMSVCGDQDLPAVRCVGIHSPDRQLASPRMHHKFVVFCKYTPPNIPDDFKARIEMNLSERDLHPTPEPYAVWTGSFNFTSMATLSFENAVYVENREIARAYFNEWEQVAALSERLDWETPWVCPEWRFGT